VVVKICLEGFDAHFSLYGCMSYISPGWSAHLCILIAAHWDLLYQQTCYGVCEVPCTSVKHRNWALLFYRMLLILPPSCSLWCSLKIFIVHFLDMYQA
jgi:hypothetical protein